MKLRPFHLSFLFSKDKAMNDTRKFRWMLLPIALASLPTPDEIRLFRVTPTVISVLDYSKGFGHTDLVNC